MPRTTEDEYVSMLHDAREFRNLAVQKISLNKVRLKIVDL